MLTFQGLYERFTNMTSDDSAANTTLGKSLVNETHKLICGMKPWVFTQEVNTTTSTAAQQVIKLPVNWRKLITWNLNTGSVKYTPSEMADPMAFDKLSAQGTAVTSDFPQYFHMREGNIYVWPAISSASLTITTVCEVRPKDMIAADYVTGTVSAIANGAVAVTGSGTTWTAAMVGRYLRITSEGQWYKITARTSDTAITIDKPYEGTTIAAGSEAYQISELPLVPEEFQDMLWYRPVAHYYMKKGEEGKSNFYMDLYDKLMRDLRNQYQTYTNQNTMQFHENIQVANINDYPTNLT